MFIWRPAPGWVGALQEGRARSLQSTNITVMSIQIILYLDHFLQSYLGLLKTQAFISNLMITIQRY